jgi:hypothetical protein
MTRHREGGATLYGANDDFKNLEALKDRLSRARPKDTTLNYEQRRGLEPGAAQGHKPTEEEPEKERDVAPIERFKKAQREFVTVAGKFDHDPEVKARGAELRQEMKSAAEEISRGAGLMREAEHDGIADQVKGLRAKRSAPCPKKRELRLNADR